MYRFVMVLIACFLLSGCMQSTVVGETDGVITVKGPRVAWGPGHDTRTPAAQKAADEYCASKGRGPAVFQLGEVKLFDGDYNQYSCSMSHEKVMENVDVSASFQDISACVRSNIPVLDDLTSDAGSIARAIATVCSSKVSSFLDLYLEERAAGRYFNDAFREQFTASQNEKILPFVLTWRRILSEGWSESQEPTQKELPDNLYGI